MTELRTRVEAPPASPTQVSILGDQYLVVMGDKRHVVGKDRVCHTCHDRCPAVREVARYLKAGGQRAPDVPALPPRPPGPVGALPPCPICGAEAVRAGGMDHPTRGLGWTCSASGNAHLYLARYGHLKEWFTREGRERHHMFVRDDGEAVITPLELAGSRVVVVKVILIPGLAQGPPAGPTPSALCRTDTEPT